MVGTKIPADQSSRRPDVDNLFGGCHQLAQIYRGDAYSGQVKERLSVFRLYCDTGDSRQRAEQRVRCGIPQAVLGSIFVEGVRLV